MLEKNYSLEAILASVSYYKKPKAKKRLIFDQSALGGISSRWVIVFFFTLPIMEYVAIFNPWVFDMLGIAQAIIFYIVFLSMLMIMVIALGFINNHKVIRQITPSWRRYFPDIELEWVLSSGTTPYKDFFTHYSSALNENLQGEALHHSLKTAFYTMQEENKVLFEAMKNRSSRTS